MSYGAGATGVKREQVLRDISLRSVRSGSRGAPSVENSSRSLSRGHPSAARPNHPPLPSPMASLCSGRVGRVARCCSMSHAMMRSARWLSRPLRSCSHAWSHATSASLTGSTRLARVRASRRAWNASSAVGRSSGIVLDWSFVMNRLWVDGWRLVAVGGLCMLWHTHSIRAR